MKSPMLLCFNMPPEKAAKLRLICMRFSIRFQPVPQEDWGKTLSALCGLEDSAPEAATPEAFSEEMMVMALFPAGMAQQFLLALKRAKLPPVALKAVLTSTNSQWNPVQLYMELCRERDALRQGKQTVHTPQEPEA